MRVQRRLRFGFFLFNLINNANNGFKGGAIYKRLFCNNVSYQDMI